VSFVRTLHPGIDRRYRAITIGFVLLSAAVFLVVGRPVSVLVAVGALNALILPVSLGAMLVASRRHSIVGDYRHPAWLIATGIVVAAGMAAMGVYTMATELPRLL
jgi:Mn2+/Fe2+ NRAMP family transporter